MYERKFQLQDLWSCALAWQCQKHYLKTHTHTILSQNVTNNFLLLATRSSHTIF